MRAGTARAELNVAGVRAALYDTGQLFWRGLEPSTRCRAAPTSTPSLRRISGSRGRSDGEVRSAGETTESAYWPGPLDADGTTTAETCTAYDRIWTVTTADLDVYDETGAAARDLAEWPVGVGAPFYVDADGDGRQGDGEPTISLDLGDAGYGTKTLDLAGGERPVIFGRQTAWWVTNDAGGLARWTPAPLGIEVRTTAWSLGDSDVPDLVESTFYRLEIINRSQETIEDTFAGLYVDADLGNFNDDYVGSDSTRSMV